MPSDRASGLPGWRLLPGWAGYPVSTDQLLMVDEQRALLLTSEESQCLKDLTANSKSDVDRTLALALQSYGIASNLTPAWHDPRIEAYWAEDVGPARESLAWIALSPAAKESIKALLEASEIEISEHARIRLVTTDDYIRPEIVLLAAQSDRPWLLARTTGSTIWLGPLFVPGKTVCWFCLAHWLRTRRYLQANLFGWADADCPPQKTVAETPATATLVAGLIAVTVASLLSAGGAPSLENSVMAIDTKRMRTQSVRVPRRAGCACMPDPLPVPHLADWANPVCGLVTDLLVSPSKKAGFFHASCRFFQPLPVGRVRPLLDPSDAFGSGLDPADARDRCIAEALERYSSVWQGSEPILVARPSDLENAISPHDLLQYSAQQYHSRGEWNRESCHWYRVPPPLSNDAAISWTPVHDLRTGQQAWAPAALSYMWHECGEDPWGIGNTNGCAAGRTKSQATLHALLELIERDALSIWWYNALSRPAIDCGQFDDPAICEAFQSLRDEGRSPVMLDLTHDLGIPAYVAVAPREDGSEPLFGASAHPTASIAAHKAASELSRTWFFTKRMKPAPALERWLQKGNVAQHRFLAPSGTAGPIANIAFEHTEEMTDYVLSRLNEAGLRAFVLDLTRSEIGLPVSRVLVPGLRQPWRRFAPGRLYTVPVRMGWLSGPLREDELNHEPCPA